MGAAGVAFDDPLVLLVCAGGEVESLVDAGELRTVGGVARLHHVPDRDADRDESDYPPKEFGHHAGGDENDESTHEIRPIQLSTGCGVEFQECVEARHRLSALLNINMDVAAVRRHRDMAEYLHPHMLRDPRFGQQ